ncbi:hypothetical protein RHMOL_Rhmol10G0110000 [Rhododendron molle]|uniref:Uncharacterized protein n=1 Tax=Rhododendron molle TaxID=49168 RepID=A0ACC0M2W9_RHOML|nr:hypothetical protein RHMOL_Rhmol10G0110000 [Rhododendron molle]
MVEKIRRFSLTQDDEDIIVNDPSLRARVVEECSASLVGKLLTKRGFSKATLKDTMRKVWGSPLGLCIVDVGDNLFHFWFRLPKGKGAEGDFQGRKTGWDDSTRKQSLVFFGGGGFGGGRTDDDSGDKQEKISRMIEGRDSRLREVDDNTWDDLEESNLASSGRKRVFLGDISNSIRVEMANPNGPPTPQ